LCNLNLKNENLSEINNNLLFETHQGQKQFTLETKFNLLITIIGNQNAGKNFIANLLHNKMIDPSSNNSN